jgi:hypothetical protein
MVCYGMIGKTSLFFSPRGGGQADFYAWLCCIHIHYVLQLESDKQAGLTFYEAKTLTKFFFTELFLRVASILYLPICTSFL